MTIARDLQIGETPFKEADYVKIDSKQLYFK